MTLLLITTALFATVVLLGYRPLANSESWRATLIPLASIMGSGFLVSAPLLAGTVGAYAVLAMSVLLALAFCVGDALRFNIKHFEPVADEPGLAHRLEATSQLVLVGAYFISVSYYIQLLAAFALHAVGIDGPNSAPILATAVLSLIGGIGVWRGLGTLAKVEKYAVGLNLGMICALLVGLAVFNGKAVSTGSWEFPSIPVVFTFDTARVLLGLLIVVQGFETSRYIGSEFPADLRIETMRHAQLLSSVIYVLFLAGATLLFDPSRGADVTAVIDMTRPIAPILPVMLTIAALGSQFSAAVADDAGGGGLIETMTRGRVPARYGYAILWVVTVVITWETDVNSIIAWASRAFALFYAIQCSIAAATAHEQGLQVRTVWYGTLVVICTLVCLLGKGGA